MDYNLRKINKAIDFLEARHLKRIRKCVAVRSVSSSRKLRPHLDAIVDYFIYLLKKLNFKVTVYKPPEKETRLDGEPLKLPKVIFGQLGDDFRKRTVLFYGHVDVVDAKKEDGWYDEPFKLLERGDNLIARGVADNKGPILAWLGVLEIFQYLKMDIPVNFKIILEGMHESGSEGLRPLITENRIKFLKNVDLIVMSNTFALGKLRPCISYGVRGLIYFFVKIKCAHKDLHAGIYGGNIHEAEADVIYLLDTLIDKDGKILIPKFYDKVTEITDEENEYVENTHFDSNDVCRDLGHNRLRNHADRVKAIKNRCHNNWITIHGIEGDFNDVGGQTVIPHKINGKFSIRIVPEQDEVEIVEETKKYLRQKFRERGSPNYLEILAFRDIPPFTNPSTDDMTYTAAKKAIKRVWGIYPDVIKDGASMPIAKHFSKVTQKSVLFLPIAQAPHNCHDTNETLTKSALLKGMKVVTAFLYEVAAYRFPMEYINTSTDNPENWS